MSSKPSIVPPLLLFVSHSSADLVVAKAVVELVEGALKISSSQIRCTSVHGYKLAVGTDSDEHLRREIHVAKAFVGLLTPNSLVSQYVLFELGARWGAKRHLAPVLAGGLTVGQLRPPLSGLNALELYTRESVVQLAQDLSTDLECDLEPMASFQSAIDAVVNAASQRVAVAPDKRSVVLSDPERRILEALRSSRLTAQDVVVLLGVEKEKAEYYLHGLSAKGVIDGALPWLAEVTAWRSPYRYSLAQEGREYLVDHGLL